MKADREEELERLASESLLPAKALAEVLDENERTQEEAESSLPLNTRRMRRRRWAAIFVIFASYVVGTVLLMQRYASVPEERASRAVIRGDWFHRDGDKFLIKGIGWDPARPGELPWARDVSVSLVDDDFRRIREAGFNTVRTWDALSWEELQAAERHGLAVLQGIWIEPDGDFADAEFQRRALRKVRDIVGYSKESRAVIAYLVMNEPEAEHVRSQGVDVTRQLLRLIAAEVERLDPGGLVAFSGWPGLEFLEEPDLHFAGANLYSFRPSALLHAVGYEGMVRLWKRLHGHGRPFLVTEYGLSVSPEAPTEREAPGGASEEEQARRLPEMADLMLAGGAAGGAAFSWIDGWWKGQQAAADERSHESNDAEEWFGLVAMERIDDRAGRPRPALEAMRRWNRAVVTSPANGGVEGRSVLLEVHAESEENLVAAASVNGRDAVEVSLTRQGPWYRGWIGLDVERQGAQHVEVLVYDRTGQLLRHLKRTVFPPGQAPTLMLQLHRGDASSVVDIRALDYSGEPLEGAEVRLSLTSAEGTHDYRGDLRTDAEGKASVVLTLPEAHAFLAAGLWLVDGDPPAAVEALVLDGR